MINGNILNKRSLLHESAELFRFDSHRLSQTTGAGAAATTANSQAQDINRLRSSMSDAWSMKVEQHLLSNKITSLKRTLLQHEIKRVAAGLSTKQQQQQQQPSSTIQPRSKDISLVPQQPSFQAMVSSPTCCSDLLKATLCDAKYISDTALLTSYRSALMGNPLMGGMSTQRNSFLLPPTAALISASNVSSLESSLRDALLQKCINGRNLDSSIGHRASFQTPSPPKNSAFLLRSRSYELPPRTLPLTTAQLERSATPHMRKRGPESFPMVLHRALLELDVFPGGGEVAAFLPDGKAFQIRSQFLFEKHVLPVFFPKMKSFASFQRQLNLYDFKRIGGAGIDRGGYQHDLFRYEVPSLASLMKRRKIKSEGVATPSFQSLPKKNTRTAAAS